MKESVIAMMQERGITLPAIADLVWQLQEKYYTNLTMGHCLEAVDAVISKREVQHGIMTGLALDILTEQKLLPQPLQQIIATDEPLYGIDEVIGMAITNIYGTIGITSFGYLDKLKIGLIGELDRDANAVNTFADDLVAAIAAAAAAKIAHSHDDDLHVK